MSEQLKSKILDHIKSDRYRPQRPRGLAKQLNLEHDEHYPAFREALRDLMHQGRIVLGTHGAVVLPAQKSGAG